jgi:hypothetical protein
MFTTAASHDSLRDVSGDGGIHLTGLMCGEVPGGLARD